MAEVGTAVPSNVNLSKQKPYAVSAYSRRVKSLANNAQAFGPDSYVNITLDTSTPGSFLDPLQSYLKFDLTIRNTNAFADYISFGPAGAASIIEEFRIYVQGTPIEEILQYNVFYELAMNQNGQCQQPYHLFKTNEMPLGIATIFHQNAIKPPMTDNEGRPMYGSVVNATTGQARGRQCAWAYADGQSLQNSKMIQSQATFSTKIPFSGCRPYYNTNSSTADIVYPIYTADAHSLLMGSRNGTTTSAIAQGTYPTLAVGTSGALFPSYSQSITGSTAVSGVELDTFTQVNISSYTSGSAQVGLDADRLNVQFDDGTLDYQTTFASYFNNGNGILPYAGSSVEFPSIIGGANVVESNPDFDPRNPLNWCNLLPATEIRPDMRTLGPDNLQDYFMFLANTKYIPIGMQGWNKYAPGTEQFDTSSYPNAPFYRSNNFTNLNKFNPLTNEASFSYTCCIPLISGVLGSFADKCWPTMLIAPGSMYIQIRTASPQKAFQLSMDPCRRVLGTIRDYLPFGGSMGGLFGQLGENTDQLTPNLVLDGNLGAGSTYYNTTPSGAQINDSGETDVVGCLPFNTFSEYKGTTSFDISNNATSVNAAGIKVQSMINGYGCIGATLGSANQRLTDTYFAGQGIGAGILFRPYSVAAMEGRWTIGRAYVSQFAGADLTEYFQVTQEASLITGTGSAGTNVVPAALNSSLDVTYKQYRNPKLANWGTTTNPITAGAYPNAPMQGAGTAIMPQCDVTVELNPSGIPLPQYWLHAAPWTKKNFMYLWSASAVAGVAGYTGGQLVYYGAKQDGLASEADACYGTFLASSIPQSRRVLTHQSGVVSYTLSNIEFVSQQIILPDSVSSSILADAAQGDISLTSNSLHNYQTPISQSTSQNLIIPAKIASANTMYCLFVPQIFVSGPEAYLYNSLRGICPFGAVADTTDGGIDRNGLTGPYSDIGLGTVAGRLLVNNIPCSGSNFQIQLKVGNELIPQQPLTTITELVTENVKAQHKLFDTTSNVNQTYSLCTRAVNVVGSTDQPPSVLSFDVLKSGNFTTTFVSAVHCDDQTAINNPANGYLYAAEANRIALTGGDPIQWEDFVIPRNPCQLELFQPPESSFVIAFDMDTWSRFSDVTRSGKFLGNNTITLTLQGATALGLGNSQTGSNGYVLQTFVVHDIRFSFQAGGSVVSYY
jgi:hypothetical protein